MSQYHLLDRDRGLPQQNCFLPLPGKTGLSSRRKIHRGKRICRAPIRLTRNNRSPTVCTKKRALQRWKLKKIAVRLTNNDYSLPGQVKARTLAREKRFKSCRARTIFPIIMEARIFGALFIRAFRVSKMIARSAIARKYDGRPFSKEGGLLCRRYLVIMFD